jgi:hypothetical protein
MFYYTSYYNPYYNNGQYYGPYYGQPYPGIAQITQITYVTQIQQAWQTQFLTQPVTQYLTDYYTSTVNSFNSQPVADPLSVIGLIGAGVVIALIAVAAGWTLGKPRQVAPTPEHSTQWK